MFETISQALENNNWQEIGTFTKINKHRIRCGKITDGKSVSMYTRECLIEEIRWSSLIVKIQCGQKILKRARTKKLIDEA